MKLYVKEYDGSIDWQFTVLFWVLGLAFLCTVLIGVNQLLPSDPTETNILFRGTVFKRSSGDRNDIAVYSVHLGGTRNERRSGSGVGVTSTGKSVGVGPVITYYEVAVSNDVKVWTKDKDIKASIDHAMLNDERITILCRLWNRDGGYEVISISR